MQTVRSVATCAPTFITVVLGGIVSSQLAFARWCAFALPKT